MVPPSDVRRLGDSSSGHFQLGPTNSEMRKIHKSHLQKKFQRLIEGVPNQGDARLLHEIYTELYITEGGRGYVNDEHEVRQIERASWIEAEQGRPIKCSDIFIPLSGQYKPIRVLTKGVAGIGKTVSVQKFILDWAEGKANQDVHFIFPLLFRELNLMRENKLSLVDLIQHLIPGMKDPTVFSSSLNRVMFILDGLDECRLPLEFDSNPRCCDVTEPAPVDVLLTNLIKGNMLPSALLWITTRPAAANQIPPKCVDQVSEIRGFKDPQKEEYFRKRISDENLASRTITHLKSSRSLYIMCHIPIFCWISAIVAERTSDESEKVGMPRTLTQMYTHFLIIQTSSKKEKYTEIKVTDEEMILKLGKLAFQQLERGNLIFYEEDVRECGIDVTEASVYSGVCTQIFKEETGLNQVKVFSFVHLSIQEFLAALYVFLCFSNRERNMPDQQQTSQLSALFRAATLHDLHKTAVDLALESKNGHLDLFLRFLLGLSLESNQNLLRHLLPQTRSQSQSSEQTAQFVKQMIRDQNKQMIRDQETSDRRRYPVRDQDESHRRINLFYCLNELNHHAVVEVIDRSSGALSVEMLLPGQWKTRAFKFEISAEQLEEFDLQKYIKTPEEDQTELLSPDNVLQKLVPGVTSACVVWIPILQSANSGQLYVYIQSVTSYLAPPVTAIFVLAVFWTRTNEAGAFWGLMVGLVVGLTRMLLEFAFPPPRCGVPDPAPPVLRSVHYLHFAIILCGLTAAVVVTISLLTPPPPPEQRYYVSI
ncbi:protein NLRC3-like [Clupea harengus]|uniref:Protein NLRC3-like n=1 Tax=Clupea harengus TaxID=7950 RepID=A0A8M1K719_CLUHA|nr:protein NLRC3-like [Clupea harengus]